MAVVYPDLENIQRLKVEPTDGEWHLVKFLQENLDAPYEIFFNPYLDGDRPDIIILKEYVAAFIIEIKDWNLSSYRVGKLNDWSVFDGRNFNQVGSPHAQAFRYKKNLYDLHLPVVGVSRLKNKYFFNLVDCFVYFHKASHADVNSLYQVAENDLKELRVENNRKYKDNEIDHFAYEKANEYIDRKSKNIRRDKSISISNDRLSFLVKKIKSKSTHVLFNESVYDDFKRRLSPPSHTLKQGVTVAFDKNQLPLTLSKSGKEKIKGVAGCGKTTIMAQRAINAVKRHGTPVLILTYNLTLKNYIKDKISDIQGCRDFDFIEVSNYHQFFNSQLNNTGQDLAYLVESYGFDFLYSTDFFEGFETIKYKTILLDEVQDYQPEWVKIIRDNFLVDQGEMVLFGDESQDIYHRNSERAQVIAQGFGRWVKLRRSYRTDFNSPLNKLFADFQLEFLISKYQDSEVLDSGMSQIGLSYGLLDYVSLSSSDWYDDFFDSVQGYISSNNLHPNDVVVLSSKINFIRRLNDYWEKREKTHCMFESYEEIEEAINRPKGSLKAMPESDLDRLINDNKDEIERIRRVKKNFFYANSGLIKFSTIHSFKGLESKAVFYIMLEDDDPEIIYTSITRSSENLVIYDIGGRNSCSDFFKTVMA